jgi:hypothetical protein
MTPPGHIRIDDRGGLRVMIEEVEHWFAPADVSAPKGDEYAAD